ncbi:hypothetical protein OS493_036261 [Desmophyllum pertusum]|uniref:UPAR/Ly6 domain-containing protein n=1 Tax=Desmophyllum pertusum TaxID=174260 RepID=A0A9X0D1H0_9CNID|nr:hypothetical protein OS493_036261 [Desmophyllum pertusum]
MAKVKQILALLFVITFSVAHSLRCHNCASSESFDECVPHEQVDCSSGFDRCYKGEISYTINSETVKTYGKGCTTAAQCSNEENLTCQNLKESGVKDVRCHLECCTGDNCNSGTAVRISVMMLLSCAVLVLGYVHN